MADSQERVQSASSMPRGLFSLVASSLVRLDEAVGGRQRLLLLTELLAAAAVVAAASANLWLMLRSMATTSLWNDELYTVNNFSSSGPWHVITDYHVANNHVFFNLVNSLTPGSASVMPLRARFWSFAAVLSALGLLLWHFGRRRRFIEGALAFALIAAQERVLDLTFQARGYGFLCLATVVLMLSVVRFIETRDNRELYCVAGASILGTWTVPTFLVFSGGTLLLLWAAFRTRAVFYCGLIVALAIAAAYAPVASQLWTETATYSEQWGEAYSQLSAVAATLGMFLWPGISDWIVMALVLVALVVPYHLRESETVLAARFLPIVVFASFTLFLFQRTPGVRTTFFLVIPLAYTLIAIGSELLRGKWAVPWLVSTVTAAVLTVSIISSHLREYRFVPMEAWLEVAVYIRAHFPAGTTVHAPFRTFYLQQYLDPAYPVAAKFDAEAFAAGKQIYVDSNFNASPRLEPKALHEGATAVHIRQRRGDFQVIASVPR